MLTPAEKIKLKTQIAAGLLAQDSDSWLEDTRYLAMSSHEILEQIIATETGELTRELLNKEELEADDGDNTQPV
jgi:hypothetical protein